MEKYGKTAVFPGGYGRIGKITHGRLWPDGVYRVKESFILSCHLQYAVLVCMKGERPY